jgi:hypothetical protein
MGFILAPEEAQSLMLKDSKNKDVLFPYLNGEDLNSRPDQSPSRWVINFQDWPLEKAEAYTDCIDIVRKKVKPERDRNNRKIRREFWWQYAERCPALYSTIKNNEKVLVCPIFTKHLSFCFVPSNQVFMNKLYIFPFEQHKHISLLNSSIHEIWARAFSSTLETRLQYTPSDCFETFPFPLNMESLNDIGERYYNHRQSIMLARQEGLTKTYNRFHNPNEHAADIVQLRALHKEMDESVAHAYGWDDLALEHGFHETKQGLRYTISEAARREVLDRLLALNHQRHAEEVAAGLVDESGKPLKAKAKSSKATGKANASQKGKTVKQTERVVEGDVASPVGDDVEQGTLF